MRVISSLPRNSNHINKTNNQNIKCISNSRPTTDLTIIKYFSSTALEISLKMMFLNLKINTFYNLKRNTISLTGVLNESKEKK